VGAALLLAACGPEDPARDILALTNARVVDGNGGPVLDNVTVVIEDGRIALIGPTAAVALPADARHMDLTGQVVMPGLVDMHYHVTTGAIRYRRDAAGRLDSTYDRRLAERLLEVALAHGITTIRDPGASRRLPVIGHLQRTSWTEAALAGIDFLTHGGNWHEAYVLPARRSAYEKLGGTMRARISWLEWLDLEGPAVDSMVLVLRDYRVSVDPTLVAYHSKFWWRDSIYQRDPDVALVPEVRENWRVLGMHTRDWTADEFDRAQAAWPKMLALVARMQRESVHLTTGSDLASPWVIPGVALHQELALLVSAGIAPVEVLRLATRNGAEALGLLGESGTVEPGKRADLVVLEADPLRDIRNTRRIRYVILGGRIFRPDELR
jgi:imidazolonepropionase-like amidohydrolase